MNMVTTEITIPSTKEMPETLAQYFSFKEQKYA
jgi:hypothetical protein